MLTHTPNFNYLHLNPDEYEDGIYTNKDEYGTGINNNEKPQKN